MGTKDRQLGESADGDGEQDGHQFRNRNGDIWNGKSHSESMLDF